MEDRDTELLCKVSANHLFLAQFEPFRATLRSLRVRNPELSRAILQTIVANGGRFDSIIWSQSCSSPALLTFLCTLELLQFNEPTSQLWSFDADALKLRAEFCLIIQNVISRVSESISSSELGAEAVADVDLNGDVSGINEHLKGLGESLRVLVKICDMGLRRLRPDLIEMDDVIDNKGDSGGDIVVEDEEMMCLRRVFLENADMFDVLSLNIEKQVGWIENEDSDMAITVRTVVKHKEVEDKVLKSLQQCIQIAHLDAMRECLMNNGVDGAFSHIRFLHLNYGINEEEYRVVSKDLLRRVLLAKDDYGDAWREMRDKFLSVYEEALSSGCTPLVKMIQVVMIILAKIPLSQGSSYTSNQFAQWQTSNHDENASHRSLQDSETMQQKEENLSGVQLKRHDTDSPNQQQKNDSSQEINSLPLHHISQDSHQTTEAEQENTLHSSRAVNMQNPEKNTQNPESPHLNLQGANNLQSMQSLTTGTSGLPRVATEASNQSESATGSSSQAAMNVAKQGKQVPFAMLFPHIQPQLDKDRAMQLQTLYLKLKKNEISKESFVRNMRSIIGDQMLKMAVYKFQSQASKNSQTVPGQFPQSQASQQQHSQMPADGSSNMAIESKAQKLQEVENQADLRGAQGSQMPSSTLTVVKQERDQTPFPIQGLNRQQQHHLHFSQASFPTFSNAGNNYSAYSASNVNSSTTQTLKQQSDDAQMRQISAQQNRNATQFGVPTQAMGMMSAPKFEKQNTFSEAKRLPGGGLNISSTSRIQQTSVQWQPSANKEQKSILSSPMTIPKPEPIDHFHDQLQRPQLSPFSSVQVDQGNSNPESSRDESIEQTSRIGLSATTSMKPSNSALSSMSSHMDTSTLLSSRTPSVTSQLGPGNNGKTPVKKPSIGQKKPLDVLGSSPPPSGKKQKVSGGFLDQSIEQLNDVTAVSGVNLREEEEQLFSGPKEDSRVSEASRRVVQEEEERLILQKIPLQKKLTEIMAKCGLKNMSSDVERCLSLCVEERMRGLISSLIRLSKQRVDIEKSRHRTIVTSDVREEIMSINRKAREEWEKKQSDVEKLQKANDPEGNIGVDGDKEKDEGRGKSMKVNKEEDDKMRTTAANVAARAAVGGDDMLSKWQLMAEQARQKREGGGDVASGSQPAKDVTRKNLSAPPRSSRDHQETEKRSQSSAIATPGAVRRAVRNQVITQTRVARSITVKDVIAVLEREPQMSKSTLIYRLYEKARSNASSAESS